MDKTAKSAVLVIGVCLTSVLGFRTARAWQAVSRGAANTVALMSDGDVVAGGFACSPLNFCGGVKNVRPPPANGAGRRGHLRPFGAPSPPANTAARGPPTAALPPGSELWGRGVS